MKITIKNTVEQLLLKNGYIDNYYCIDSRLTTRLSAVILNLKLEGWEFDEDKSGYLGDTKNWRYVVKKSPWRERVRTLSTGEIIKTYEK